MVRVLIVEDSRTFRTLFAEALRSKFSTLLIEEATDGKEAFQKIAEAVPDIIFMDIRLPGENGLKLTHEIKERYPDITIIILTSYDLPEYRQASFDSGANCFIAKDSLDFKEIARCAKMKLEPSVCR